MIHTLAFLPGCSRSREKLPSTSIRPGIQSSTICALPLIAAEKDFFRKQGVDADIKHYPSGKLALMGMFAGEVDMAAVADMPIMSNSFKRNDFAVFGQIAWTV
jgi:NitT/TauT family transport system substrate-binding protein